MNRRPPETEWQLRLYVAGMSPTAKRALTNIEKICQERLDGSYELEVIDLMQEPDRAEADQILAVPTLVRHAPPPMRKIIGDLSDTQLVLRNLDLSS